MVMRIPLLRSLLPYWLSFTYKHITLNGVCEWCFTLAPTIWTPLIISMHSESDRHLTAADSVRALDPGGHPYKLSLQAWAEEEAVEEQTVERVPVCPEVGIISIQDDVPLINSLIYEVGFPRQDFHHILPYKATYAQVVLIHERRHITALAAGCEYQGGVYQYIHEFTISVREEMRLI